LELAFESRALRITCEDEREAQRELGPAVAETLKHRLADLHAATSIHDLVAGNPRLLIDGNEEALIVDLTEGFHVVLEANHARSPLTKAGRLDWDRVSRVKLLRIERNHD
jgi:toxin HigB-1